MNCTIRRRSSASGNRPRMAPRLSVICAGSAVPGMTAVTLGSPSRYLRKNCAQLPANAEAQSGSVLPRTARNNRPRPNGNAVRHPGLVIPGERQDALLSFAVFNGIVDLYEIRFFASEDGFDGGEGTVEGRGDADVAAHALCFPFLESRKRLLRIANVVELEQIELLGPQSAQRALELCGIGRGFGPWPVSG